MRPLKFIFYLGSIILFCFGAEAADSKQPVINQEENLTAIALAQEEASSGRLEYSSPEGLIYKRYANVKFRVKHILMHNSLTPEEYCSNTKDKKTLVIK